MQKNWIGKSYGCEINFQIDRKNKFERIKIFTTRPDTIFGASFIALSIDHPIVKNFEGSKDFLSFKSECSKMGTTEEALASAEKIGFNTNLFALHPFKKETKLPIYIANFVLMDYGTGANFGCPAHDQRDLDFARKYDLDVITVVAPNANSTSSFAVQSEAYLGDGVHVNSGFLNGLNIHLIFRA